MTGVQQQRNTSSITIKPKVSDLAISKMQNITPIMKSPYKLMIFLLCLVLLKNDIGLFTSDSKGFTMTSINNKVHIIALPIILDHGQSSYWTAKSSFLFLASNHTEADPNYTLGVDFWTMIFHNLKNSG